MDLAKGLHERLVHDQQRGELRDGAIRYFMMRPDALMGMFRRMDEQARLSALRALSASLSDNGGKSVSTYRANGASDRDALMEVVARTAAELGWGAWQYGELADGSFEVTVRNSPFAHGYGESDAPVCAPIAGILSSMAPLLIGSPGVAREMECSSHPDNEQCRFRIQKADD